EIDRRARDRTPRCAAEPPRERLRGRIETRQIQIADGRARNRTFTNPYDVAIRQCARLQRRLLVDRAQDVPARLDLELQREVAVRPRIARSERQASLGFVSMTITRF